MKQTFYLQKYKSGDIVLSTQARLGELTLIGTITLDVEPIRKEVEKVIGVTLLTPVSCFTGEVRKEIPIYAYDVKVIYKVKE